MTRAADVENLCESNWGYKVFGFRLSYNILKNATFWKLEAGPMT
jgi:hypothetical protein